MSDRISPWLSHLTPSLEFLSYLGFVHLDGNVLNLQVQTGLWTLQFQLSIWVDAHFSWSKDRLENYKTKQWENDPFITEQHKPRTQTKPRTCSRTCGLYSQDQKTHCTGNEGGPCPYCWWNTLTPPAWGEGEEEGESRKRKKEGRSSLVRVQENFPKHSKMSIIFMDQTNWRFTTRSHNCLAFGIIPFCLMFSYSSSLCWKSLILSPGVFLRFRHGCSIPMCEISTSFHPKKEFWNQKIISSRCGWDNFIVDFLINLIRRLRDKLTFDQHHLKIS